MQTRIIATVLLISCFFTLCGCSDPQSPAIHNGTSGSVTSTENSSENNNENSSKTISLASAFAFFNGIAPVTLVETSNVDGNTVSEEYRALIDASGNILHKFAANEITQYSHLRFYNGVTCHNNAIYDVNFNVIASPKTKEYDFIVTSNAQFGSTPAGLYIHDCGYFIVCKTEESFHGDKHYIGVLDATGNFTVPLSDTHPIAVLMSENNYTFETLGFEYVGNGYYGLHPNGAYLTAGYYNVVTNTITPDYPRYESNYSKFFKINEHGESTLVSEGYAYRHITDSIYLCYPYNHGMAYEGSGWKLMDLNTNTVLIDFGEYQLDPDYTTSYYNGYFLVNVKNNQGTVYRCLFDQSGEPVFDPIRLDGYTWTELSEDGFILEADGVLSFYDYEGNMSTYDTQGKSVRISGYHDGWVLIVVQFSSGEPEYRFINSKGESMY